MVSRPIGVALSGGLGQPGQSLCHFQVVWANQANQCATFRWSGPTRPIGVPLSGGLGQPRQSVCHFQVVWANQANRYATFRWSGPTRPIGVPLSGGPMAQDHSISERAISKIGASPNRSCLCYIK